MGVTFPLGTPIENILPGANWAHTGKGLHGYKSAFQDRNTGARLETEGTETMGTHLTLSGDSLSEFRKGSGLNDQDILRHMADLRGRASRLDLCINLYETSLTPHLFMKAYRAHTAKSPARGANITSGVQDGIDGETLYIGSRDSERFMRIYDKAAESKIVDAGAWIRLEMEFKSMKARAIANACQDNPVSNVINESFRKYLDWGNRDYLAALSGPGAPIIEIGRQNTNRRKWLLEVVAKSLARQLYVEPDFGMPFRALVDFHLDEMERAEVDLWLKVH